MKNQNLGILVLRVSLGALMLIHGISKLQHGIDGIVGMIEQSGLPGIIAYGVYLGEVIAPLMLIVGFRTRIAAIPLVVTMLVAIFLVSSGNLFSLTTSGGLAIELPALYLFGALLLFFTGGGNIAVSNNNRWD